MKRRQKTLKNILMIILTLSLIFSSTAIVASLEEEEIIPYGKKSKTDATFLSSLNDITNEPEYNKIINYYDETVFSDDKSSNDQVIMKYSFERPIIKNVTINGVVYNQVVMPNVSCVGNPGEPYLPMQGANILLPYGTKVRRIKIRTDGKVYLGDNFTVEPAGVSSPLVKPTAGAP